MTLVVPKGYRQKIAAAQARRSLFMRDADIRAQRAALLEGREGNQGPVLPKSEGITTLASMITVPTAEVEAPVQDEAPAAAEEPVASEAPAEEVATEESVQEEAAEAPQAPRRGRPPKAK